MNRAQKCRELLHAIPADRRSRASGLPLVAAMFVLGAGMLVGGLALSACTKAAAASEPSTAGSAQAPSGEAQAPVLLIGMGMHIEPFGSAVSPLAGGAGTPESGGGRPHKDPATAAPPRPQPDYNDPVYFEHSVADIEAVAEIVERHSAVMTVQAQSPFTTTAAALGNPILSDLQTRGHEIALHFHEDAHLGTNCETLPVATWAAVMAEEIAYLEDAGASSVRYWSGGNLYPEVLEAAHLAGLTVMSDYKNPHEQSTDPLVLGVNPWRPAAGPLSGDLSGFAQHDPAGAIVYLPDGAYDPADFGSKRDIIAQGGEQAYFDYLADSLERSLAAVEAGEVGVFHITLHPGELRGSSTDPYGGLERFLTDVVDPLVKAGKVEWATFSQMADAYLKWEAHHPAIDARVVSGLGAELGNGSTSSASGPSPVVDPEKPYISFVINSDDFRYVDDSADTIIRLTDLFERYGIRGDFYFTAPLVAEYVKKRPDVVSRLRESEMTITYHHRAPHPLVSGLRSAPSGPLRPGSQLGDP